MRIINPDGSEVEMCGNGARCSAHYASICGFGKNIDIESKAGIIRSVVSSGRVKLDMGKPHALELDLNLGIGQNMLVTHSINTGVPHVVHIVEEGLDTYDVEKIGRAIRQHPHFAPEGTNANFAETLDRSSAMIRTYERGVEQETLACGTGTTAAALILGILGYVDPPVKMLTKSGEELTVHFELDGSSVKNVFLEGESRMVFEGKI
jgi:diaminopimelate epimerase